LLHETVAEYIQILTLQANELKAALGITPPSNVAPLHRLRIFGGGALIFNEYGQLKYQIANRIENAKRQQARLDWLAAQSTPRLNPGRPRVRNRSSPIFIACASNGSPNRRSPWLPPRRA
jgi:hypothetical protein